MTKTETHKIHPARRAVLAAAVSMIGLTAAARAQTPAPALVSLQVVNRETGEAARVWRHAGRLYVAGQPGARYSLRVTNNTGGRVLAVMSVDGVNILTGETAAYGQRGYVFGPYQTYEVKGWRKSENEIAAFNFAPQAQSYAARTGRPSDVGVIGIAAFRERVVAPAPVAQAVMQESRRLEAADSAGRGQARRPGASAAPPPPLPIPPVQRRAETSAPPPLAIPPVERRVAAAPSSPVRAEAEAAQPAAKLGTGHGEREWSTITKVEFTRETTAPQFIYRLEYDSRERLIASGVMPRPRPAPPTPRPFPASPDGYVPDPPRGE